MSNSVAIITLYGNNNYGNKLQNYALQEYLKKYFKNVDTLINYPITNKAHRYYLRNIKNVIKSAFKSKSLTTNKNRLNCFLDFNNYINYNARKITIKNAKKFDYDYFVVGSDQVWNYHYALNDIELLSFAPADKRISYAASFGFLDIPDVYKIKMKNELEKFNSISVREEEAKELLDSININKDVTVLVDPTFLLTASQWDKVAKKPLFDIPKKYILLYFLGNISNERYSKIKKFAISNNCEIVSLLDKNTIYYETGPSEFLYLVKNSYAVFTDSFHSSIFSIIYNRPFMIFDRDEVGIDDKSNMNSRLVTLTKLFKLDNMYSGMIDFKKMQLDSKNNNIIIESERDRANKFIENAIKSKRV